MTTPDPRATAFGEFVGVVDGAADLIGELTTQVETLTRQVTTLAAQLDADATQLTANTAQLASDTATMADLRSQLDAANASLTQARADLATAQAATTAATAQADGLRAQVATLQAQVAQLQAQLASQNGLPKAGTGVLFGYYQSGNADPTAMESGIARKVDAVHRYYDFNGNNAIPLAADVTLGATRLVHMAWETRTYNGGFNTAQQPAPAGSYGTAANQKVWTYAQITSGALDVYLAAVAGRIAAHPEVRYLVDLDHEMDDRPDIGGAATQRAAAGTRQEYAAAHRYIVDFFRARNVRNVTWAWTVSGWYAGDASKAWSYQQLWPGKGYVDIIMWDPYNNSASNWRSFTTVVGNFYRALKGGLLDPVDTTAKTLPVGLGEYGCIADPRRPDWLRSVAAEVKTFPDLVFVDYFSSGTCALQGDSASISAFAALGADPYLKTRP